MRSSVLGLGVLLGLLSGGASRAADGPLRIDPQPVYSPECGCSLTEGEQPWVLTFVPPLLMQELDDGAPAVLRLDGADRVLPMVTGALNVWGASCGMPVNARFAGAPYVVWFAGFVTRTCYENDGCEHFEFRGRLSVVREDGARTARPVTGSCGC